MPIETKPAMQPYCEPVSELGAIDTPEEVAAYMMEESLDKVPPNSNSAANFIAEEMQAIDSSPLYKTEAQRDQQRAPLEAGRPIIELGDEARRTQIAFGCGGCALKGTCEVKAQLDGFIQIASERQQMLRTQIEARETSERILPLLEGFTRWEANQRVLKNQSAHDLRRPDLMKRIKENNVVHGQYMQKLLELEEPEDRNRMIQDVYASLSPNLQKKFVEEGFVDGVVTELFVFEELKKLEESLDCQVELSSVDEDVHDGYDIKLTLNKSKQVFYLDAKSKMPPDANTRGKHPENFGEKNSLTRNGESVYAVCPNPANSPQHSYLETRILEPGGRSVLSFTPRSFRREIKPFVTVVRESLSEVLQQRKKDRESIRRFVKK